MQSPTWIALFQRLSVDQQANLLIVTSIQDELAVQEIVRLEPEYLAIRGRKTGMAEVGGGFYFIPYNQIVYLGFQRPVKEAEIRKIYGAGEDGAVRLTAAVPSPEPAAPLPPDEPAPPAPEPPPPPEGSKSGERPVGSAKAALLERLRARRASGEANRPPSK
jgi:hypothetical protein